MRKLFIILPLLFATHTFADAKSEKIGELMKAQGLLETWTQQIELGKKYNKKTSTDAIEQVLSKLNPSDEFKKRLRIAADTFIKKTEAPWTPEKIVDVWAGFYGPEFTETELDQLIAFYRSPLGQKDIRASRKAVDNFSKYFQEASQPILEKATSDFVEELQIIAKECNCAK
ncbi:MAG: DUF2059 domain-containing protein [Pseudomonas sp.]|uniref:DUF2059 domain-containing protein n=1 Tax=Pseudomonas sp. TaxID=306 RepID=UPI0033945C00